MTTTIKRSNSLTNLYKFNDENNTNKWNMSCNDVKYGCDDDLDCLSGDCNDNLNINKLENSIDSLEECNIYRLCSSESKNSSSDSDDYCSRSSRKNTTINSTTFDLGKKYKNVKNTIYINNIIENIKIFKDTNDIENIAKFDPFTNRYTYNKFKSTKYRGCNDSENLCY